MSGAHQGVFMNLRSFGPQQQLYSWGYNRNGALGLNDTANRSSPVQVGALTTWAEIAGGDRFSFAIETDGSLYAWGANYSGNLGLNNTTNYSSPVQVGALTTWAQVAAGTNVGLAIKTDGTMWSWGNGSSGRLGLNDTYINRSSPVQIGALTTWAQVTVGTNCSLAIETDGSLYAWGAGNNGQLGLNDNGVSRSSPVQIGALTNWSQVSVGVFHCLAIKTDGTMWSWGYGNAGRLGHNNTVSRSSPVQIGALTTWAQASCGNNFDVAIKTDGTMWSWGDRGQGRLGQQNVINRSSPVQIGALNTWAQVAARYRFCLAIKTDGTMWSWGNNSTRPGGLGLNDTIDRSSPVQIGALTTWVQLSKGSMTRFSQALSS